MAKLSTLKPRLGSLAPRLGYAAGDEKARDRQRRDTQPWRNWYKSARWERLRQQVLVRDMFTCQRTGELCTGKSPAPNSPVVNHKRPHRGNAALFWDIDNLECVSKAVHDSLVQSEERQAGV